MVDREDEDLQMALRMSLQSLPPEAKRSKPLDITEESVEATNRRVQRELMATAAEKRIKAAVAAGNKSVSPAKPASAGEDVGNRTGSIASVIKDQTSSTHLEKSGEGAEGMRFGFGEPLSLADAEKLFLMVFGNCVSRDVLAQWSNQGIRFSSDPETCMGLVQEEGGPCGILATIQFNTSTEQWWTMEISKCGFSHSSIDVESKKRKMDKKFPQEEGPVVVRSEAAEELCLWGHVGWDLGETGEDLGFAYVLKYLLFFSHNFGKVDVNTPLYELGQNKVHQDSQIASNNFASITDYKKERALVYSMAEILFLCGSGKQAVVATIGVDCRDLEGSEGDQSEVLAKALKDLSIATASDLQKILRISTYSSQATAMRQLIKTLPLFQSRMGAMLFLISALLSRGLESIQADRDDPSQPLVTAPFGHASQEIVNLLICGEAVSNVFDGRMDVGDGLFVKGVAMTPEIGFLLLLESLNFCKVGQHLKCPRWPIWVVGSESHYTVLFALNPAVQEENELEERESKIRKAFDAQDQSGGGGFIGVEGFQQVLREANINLPPAKFDHLCSSEFIVWSELWQVLLELDKSCGGLKDSSGLMGKKLFDLYHFNGIAKSVSSSTAGGESPLQKPRLCKLSVVVPPRWTQEEFLADVVSSSGNEQSVRDPGILELNQLPQHAPLVDCIRTRWPRAVCSWVGDAPSIV
ncbi:hypothetical protein ZIOFF_061586 [Zingiber officinale]|uniref:Deubiquitinating enzyme MINDY-3/4 conserved domain-containing protein n=1 Tax=Zingiber officinale TaxID=94328 RepID=A0A8J5KEQ4_ZINOF|nr:hypothetical protein ZIOFF_061586 [Zingiber officinale]